MPNQFLTVSFKTLPLTVNKRNMLAAGMRTYTDAAQDLLGWCEENIDLITENGKVKKKDGEALSKWTEKSLQSTFPKEGDFDCDLHSSLKAGVMFDIRSNMASYISLVNKELCDEDGGEDNEEPGSDVGFPVAFLQVEDLRLQALEEMRWIADDEEREAELRSDVMRKPRASVRTAVYTRSRDFDILVKPDLSAWYACLPLFAAKEDYGSVKFDGRLINVTTGEPKTGSRKSAVLLPLHVNDWQRDKFLMSILDGPENAAIKSAKLRRRADGDFFLDVSVGFESPEKYEPKSILCITKDVLFEMNATILDMSGALVDHISESTGLIKLQMDVNKRVKSKQEKAQKVTWKDYKRRAQEEMLHKLANHVVELALKNESAVVAESSDINVKSSRLKAQWRKYLFVLEYKCNLAGVPFRGEMWTANATKLCSSCGQAADTKKEGDNWYVVCSSCKEIASPGLTRGVNIGRRYFYKKKDWEKKGGYEGFHRSFVGVK